MKSGSLFSVAACVFAGILLMAAVLFVGLKVFYQIPAESFLKDFSALKAGSSTFEDVQRIRAKHPGKSQNIAGVEQPCSAESCELMFAFANWGLNSLPGANVVTFGGNIVVKNGRVEAATLIYQARPRPDAKIPEQIDDPQRGKMQIVASHAYMYAVVDAVDRAENNYGIRKTDVDSSGIPHTLYSRLGPRSSPADRKTAYSIDLSCLSKWYGCDNPTAIYLAHWQSLQ
jgi:hypothetical protein